jgi:hypothetical protein
MMAGRSRCADRPAHHPERSAALAFHRDRAVVMSIFTKKKQGLVA